MLLDYGFNTLNINKITNDIFPDNQSIIRLPQKLEFQEEGRLKQQYFYQGECKDVMIYSLLRYNFKKRESTHNDK